MNFYTQNGWAGSNYDSNLSIADICKNIRSYCKQFKGYKFSVRKINYLKISVELKECPVEITNEKSMFAYLENNQFGTYYIQGEGNKSWFELTTEQKESECKKVVDCWSKYKQFHGVPKNQTWLNPEVEEVLRSVYTYMQSFNYDDSEGMIDYFDTNFYHSFEIDIK